MKQQKNASRNTLEKLPHKQVFTSSLLSSTSYLKCRFTLIELLVVIAIISILAGMLLPALSQVKNTSKNTTCMNNIRQVEMGFTHYAADFDNFHVAYNNGAFSYGGSSINWVRMMTMPTSEFPATSVCGLGYIKTPYEGGTPNNAWEGILRCPAQLLDYKNQSSVAGVFGVDKYQRVVGTCYGFYSNWGVWRTGPTGMIAAEQNAIFVNVQKLKHPSQTHHLGEVPNYTVTPFLFIHPNASGNMTFYDGHVENIRMSDINVTPATPISLAADSSKWPWI